MAAVSGCMDGDKLELKITGEVDSANAADIAEQIDKIYNEDKPEMITVDCADLTYISSAGLRVLLGLRRRCPKIVLENVNNDLYHTFDLTGFTEMMTVRRQQRVISVEGCEELGSGFNGRVCRIAPDTIVKVYYKQDGLEKFNRERELARKAFVLGIPTAIPYDIVKIREGGYGAVFELLHAKTYAAACREGEPPLDFLVAESIRLLRYIHTTRADDDFIPDMRTTAAGWVEAAAGHLEAPLYEKLKRMLEAMPPDDHLIHGDFHFKNIMLQEHESVLIDMDHLSRGNPVFELANMFAAYCGYSGIRPGEPAHFFNLPAGMTTMIWEKSEALYLEGREPEEAKAAQKRIRTLGYAHELARCVRRQIDPEERKKLLRHFAEQLTVLIPQVERLEI